MYFFTKLLEEYKLASQRLGKNILTHLTKNLIYKYKELLQLLNKITNNAK